jgi:hypothetical protein
MQMSIHHILRGVLTLIETIKSEAITRRKALSLFGKGAALGVAAFSTVLTLSDAEAQTAGMERRQERRSARSGFGRASAHRDTHQFGVAQLLHARRPLV